MKPIDYIGKSVTVTMDREMGSAHPKHGFIYPVNYGFINGTTSEDGEELDAYVLGVFEPMSVFEGECIAVIERSNDNDPKLIVVPTGKNYSNEAIMALIEFQERFFNSIVVRG